MTDLHTIWELAVTKRSKNREVWISDVWRMAFSVGQVCYSKTLLEEDYKHY